MITANIATQPNREKQLGRTVKSLYNQVDKINIWLNDYVKIPDWCLDSKIRTRMSLNVGDQGKFMFNEKGYYFSCDDDLVYPPDYVEALKAKIKGNIVTIHGKNFLPPIESYYHGAYDKIRCDNLLEQDKQVQIPGTGVMAFHTDTISFDPKDFKRKNMADIWVGIKAKRLGIPIICIAHPQNWVRLQETESSIWHEHHEKDQYQTKLINDNFCGEL